MLVLLFPAVPTQPLTLQPLTARMPPKPYIRRRLQVQAFHSNILP